MFVSVVMETYLSKIRRNLIMAKSYYIGMEASNGYVKATSNVANGEVDTYLNTLRPVSEAEYENQDSEAKAEVFKFQTGVEKPKYFKVGQTLTSDEQIYFSDDDKGKYTSLDWLAANMIAIYRQLEEEQFEGAPIYVVTGLPTNHSRDEQLKEEMQKALTKTFVINDRSIRVNDVTIVPQGDASFYNDFLTDEGELNEEFLKETASEDEDQQSTILYFDLGFGTCDIKTVVDYTVIPNKSKELPGMEAQWVKAMDSAIEKNPAFASVEILGVEKQLRQGGTLKINNEKADVTDERNEILNQYARQLIGAITKAPFKGMLITQCRFVGGGTMIMKEYISNFLKEKFESNPEHIKTFKFIPNSQATNARGFYKVCVKKYKN